MFPQTGRKLHDRSNGKEPRTGVSENTSGDAEERFGNEGGSGACDHGAQDVEPLAAENLIARDGAKKSEER
ncbi:MAG: hypothetical protein L6R36_009118, partial [Xanthoria steineri]